MPEIINAEIVKAENTQAAGMATIAEGLVKKAEALVIASQEDAEAAVTLGFTIKDTAKNMDDARDALVRPFNNAVKTINSWFPGIKLLIGPNGAKDQVRDKVVAWNQKLTAAKAAADAKAAKEAEEEALKLAQKLQDKGNPELAEKVLNSQAAAIANVPAPVTAPIQAAGQSGKATARQDWEIEVTDLSQVPIEHHLADMVSLRKAVRAGARDIPGTRIFLKDNVSFRR